MLFFVLCFYRVLIIFTVSCPILLGLPWIHMARVVPSNLHQKVKCVVEEKLISVVVEENMIAATMMITFCIEINDEDIDFSSNP